MQQRRARVSMGDCLLRSGVVAGLEHLRQQVWPIDRRGAEQLEAVIIYGD